jgi:hypothetical protein
MWRLEDEWWRERPISRRYWHLELDSGKRINVFQDLIDGAWYQQP